MQDRLDALTAAKKAHSETITRLIPAGHRCGPVSCTAEQWAAMEEAGDMEKAARIALIPTEQDAINLMNDCYRRLEELGWKDPVYAPKDGSPLDLIELGSTGIHRGAYEGEWPTGGWWIYDGDVWPCRPAMARAASADTDPKGGDAKQAPCESIGSAVPEGETP